MGRAPSAIAGCVVRLCPQSPGHVWYSDASDDAEGRPLCILCGGRGPVNYGRRKPYEAPAIATHMLSELGELCRLELLMLEEELARVSFHGSAFKAWARARIALMKKTLDTEVRGKLAAAGLESDPEWMRDPPATPRNTGTERVSGTNWCPECGIGEGGLHRPSCPRGIAPATPQSCECVNPPRLAIGETTCPACGLGRAILP